LLSWIYLLAGAAALLWRRWRTGQPDPGPPRL